MSGVKTEKLASPSYDFPDCSASILDKLTEKERWVYNSRRSGQNVKEATAAYNKLFKPTIKVSTMSSRSSRVKQKIQDLLKEQADDKADEGDDDGETEYYEGSDDEDDSLSSDPDLDEEFAPKQTPTRSRTQTRERQGQAEPEPKPKSPMRTREHNLDPELVMPTRKRPAVQISSSSLIKIPRVGDLHLQLQSQRHLEGSGSVNGESLNKKPTLRRLARAEVSNGDPALHEEEKQRAALTNGGGQKAPDPTQAQHLKPYRHVKGDLTATAPARLTRLKLPNGQPIAGIAKPQEGQETDRHKPGSTKLSPADAARAELGPTAPAPEGPKLNVLTYPTYTEYVRARAPSINEDLDIQLGEIQDTLHQVFDASYHALEEYLKRYDDGSYVRALHEQIAARSAMCFADAVEMMTGATGSQAAEILRHCLNPAISDEASLYSFSELASALFAAVLTCRVFKRNLPVELGIPFCHDLESAEYREREALYEHLDKEPGHGQSTQIRYMYRDATKKHMQESEFIARVDKYSDQVMDHFEKGICCLLKEKESSLPTEIRKILLTCIQKAIILKCRTECGSKKCEWTWPVCKGGAGKKRPNLRVRFGVAPMLVLRRPLGADGRTDNFNGIEPWEILRKNARGTVGHGMGDGFEKPGTLAWEAQVNLF